MFRPTQNYQISPALYNKGWVSHHTILTAGTKHLANNWITAPVFGRGAKQLATVELLNRKASASLCYHLVGLVVKASVSKAEDPGFESRLRQDFSGSSHTSDIKIGTPVATLPGDWHYRVSAGTGRHGVSILWLGEVESLICNFYLSVAALKIVCADQSLRYAGMLLGR